MHSIAFHSVSVDFGATRALDGIDVAISPGDIVGLLGHNGAGKSTLVSVAAGIVQPSSGSLEITGEEVTDPTPQRISSLGLAFVNQEPTLVGSLSVHDNLFLGNSDIPRRTRREVEAQALGRVGLADLPVDTIVSDLPVGTRQLIDLARSLVRGDIRVLFLDEPTAALGAEETERLHGLIREFAAAGTSIVYVSHRLPDVLDVCTRVVVLNAGRVVQDSTTESLSVPGLARVLAPDFSELEQCAANELGPEVLAIEGPAHMRFHAGEIVGMFGMAAGNQFKLLESVFGWQEHQAVNSFEFRLDERTFTPKSPTDSIRKGVHLSPAERETEGLLQQLSARDNVLLPWYRTLAPWRPILASTGESVYAQARDRMRVHGPGGGSPIAAFSGGNKQKHLLARWMFPHPPRLLLLSQPTQGVDIGAKNDIVRALRALSAAGCAIVVASAESDEIARMCQRSYVIYDTSVAEVPAGPTMEEDLLRSLLELSAE